jgi:hypothetical protein
LAAPIGPGDWVECVKTMGHPAVTLHALYLVEALADWYGLPCLILAGVVNEHGHRRVRADCFRPIYRPKSEIIEALKTPVTRTPRPAKKHWEEA